MLHAFLSHPPWLDHLNNIWWSVQVMKLLIMRSSLASLLGQNIFLTTLFSHTLNLYFSLSVQDQISHSYEKTGKFMILNILILKF
jgi:hypothetical protein